MVLTHYQKHSFFTFSTLFVLVFCVSNQALAAGTLGDMMDRALTNSLTLKDLAAFFGYLTAFIFAPLGLYKLKLHVEQGPQSVPLAEPLKLLFVAGVMLTLPIIGGAIQQSFTDGAATQDIGWTPDAGAVSGTTLDGLMMKVMANGYMPFIRLLQFFCYVSGTILLLVAVHRFTKTAQQGPQGPFGLGTVGTFILAGVLFSLGPSIGTFTETFFGGRDSFTSVDFLALAGQADAKLHAENVIISILAFMIIVGIISMVRGFFILRGLAEGNQQMTMMAGLSHIIAGAILVNFGQFANIIQETIGLTGTGLQFST